MQLFHFNQCVINSGFEKVFFYDKNFNTLLDDVNCKCTDMKHCRMLYWHCCRHRSCETSYKRHSKRLWHFKNMCLGLSALLPKAHSPWWKLNMDMWFEITDLVAIIFTIVFSHNLHFQKNRATQSQISLNSCCWRILYFLTSTNLC